MKKALTSLHTTNMLEQYTESLCSQEAYILGESKITAKYMSVIGVGRELVERKSDEKITVLNLNLLVEFY